MGTYFCGGNHQARSHPGSCNRSYQLANRGPADYTRRRLPPAPSLSQLNRLSHEVSQRQSIRLEQHQSWQLLTVSKYVTTRSDRTSLEFALRSVAAEHSESPMYLVFPALRISSSAGIDSVRGVSMKISN